MLEILITFAIVSIGWYIYHKNTLYKLSKENDKLHNDLNNQSIHENYKINHQVSEKVEDLNNKILGLRKELIDVERESYEKGKRIAEENFAIDYVVQVNPYKRIYKEKKDGILAIGSTEKVEIGYQYQLFVKGWPSLSAAVIILETYEIKDFKLNEEAVRTLVNSAIGDKAEIAGGIIKIANTILEKK